MNLDSWHSGDNGYLPPIDAFEQMIKRKESFFFDVDDFASIIDYYIEVSSIEMARLALKHGMELHPGSVVLSIREARIHAITNNTDTALNILARAENLEPFNTEIIREKASILSQMEKPLDAIAEYKKLPEEEDAEEVYSNIAYEYQNLDQHEHAIHYLKKVLTINPDNENTLFELAFCYEACGAIQESARYFEAYLKEDPLSPIAWFNLGVAYTRLDKPENALEAFDYCIALEPDHASAHFNRATVLSNEGKYHQAIQAYKESISLEKPQAISFHYLAECYEKTQDYDSAVRYYMKALEVNNNFTESIAGLASAFYESGNYEKALPYIKQALLNDEGNSLYELLYADICKGLNDYTTAARYFEKALPGFEHPVDIYLDLAQMITLRDNNMNSGIQILKNAEARHPNNPDIQYRLSFYLLNNNQRKEGLRRLKRALKLAPDKLFEFINLGSDLQDDPEVLTLIHQARPLP